MVVSPPAPRSLLLLQPHLADSPSPVAVAASFSERHLAGVSVVDRQEGRSSDEGVEVLPEGPVDVVDAVGRRVAARSKHRHPTVGG